MTNQIAQRQKELAATSEELAGIMESIKARKSGPQSRQIIEELENLKKRAGELERVETALRKALQIAKWKEARADRLAEIIKFEEQVRTAREELDQIAAKAKKDPFLDELLGKFGLRSLNKAQGLFNLIDNLTSHIQNHWEEIQRLDAQIAGLSE